MNKEIAEKTMLAMMMANSVVDRHLRNLHDVLPREERKLLARKSGKVMGEIYFDFLAPLWEEYPELLPKDMNGEYVVDQRIFEDVAAVLDKHTGFEVPVND